MRLLLLLLSAGVLVSFRGSKQLASAQAAPGFLDFDNLPETGFSCSGKVIGGYYADIETGCQMFHVCTVGQKGEVMDIKFLCLNGTVFDQETRVCERVDEVDCSKTEGFYDLNLELYGAQGFSIDEEEEGDEDEEEESDVIKLSSPIPDTTSTSTTTTSTTSRPPPTPAINFPSSSPGAVALLTLHNTFNNLQQPAANLQPPTPPSYTIRQQQHPHGVAHTYFSNTPRPFHPPFNFFGRSLSSPAPTVIATSRSVTSSVSVPVTSHIQTHHASSHTQHHIEHPPSTSHHKYGHGAAANDPHTSAHVRQLITQREHAEKASVQQQEVIAQQQEASAKAEELNKQVQQTQQLIAHHQQQQQASAHAQHAKNLLVQQKREQDVAAQQQLVQQTAANQQIQDEEYDADYALESFFRDVPKLQVARSSSVSISTSSSSSVAPNGVTQISHPRKRRQSRSQRQRFEIAHTMDDIPDPPTTRSSRRSQQSFQAKQQNEDQIIVRTTEASRIAQSIRRGSPRELQIENAQQERRRASSRRIPTTRATYINNNKQYDVNAEITVPSNVRVTQLNRKRPSKRIQATTETSNFEENDKQSSILEVQPMTTPPPVFPTTSFSCANKIKGGFYADVEADCTVFHICSQGRHNKVTDNKFLCGVGTRFDQKSRTCVAKDQVTCSNSETLYHLNDHFLPPLITKEEQVIAGFESKKISNRKKRATTKKGAPRYKLSTLPEESRDFVCPTEDGAYADFPSDCQAYHQCTGNAHSLHICQHPNVFNEALGVCDSWENVDCELFSDGIYESHKTGKRRKRATSKKGAPRYKLSTLPAESKNFICPSEDGAYADFLSDCQAYHQCNNNAHTLHICPHPSVFNEALGVCDSWENVDCELYSDAFYDSHKTKRVKRSVTCDTADLPAGTPIPDFQSNCTKYHICVHSEYQSDLTMLRLSCAPGKVMDAKKRKCVPGYTCPSRMVKPRKNKKAHQKKNKNRKNYKTVSNKPIEIQTTQTTFTYNKNSKDIHSKNLNSKNIKASKFRRWLLTGPEAPSKKSLNLNLRIKRSTITGLQKLQEFTRNHSNFSMLTSVLLVKHNSTSKVLIVKDILKKKLEKKLRIKRTSNPRYSRVKKPNLRAAILDADSESLEELLELRAALKRRKYESEYEDYEETPRHVKTRPHYSVRRPNRRRPVIEYEDSSVEYEDYEPVQEAVEEEIAEYSKENLKDTENLSQVPNINEHMQPVPIAGTDLAELLKLAKAQANEEPLTQKNQNSNAALTQLLASLLTPKIPLETTTSKSDSETTTTLPAPNETTKKLVSFNSFTEQTEIVSTTESSAILQDNLHDEYTTLSLTVEEITSKAPIVTSTEKATTLRPYVIRRIPTPVPTTTLTPPVIRRMPIIRPPEQRSGKYSGVRKNSRTRLLPTPKATLIEETRTTEVLPNISVPSRQRYRTTTRKTTISQLPVVLQTTEQTKITTLPNIVAHSENKELVTQLYEVTSTEPQTSETNIQTTTESAITPNTELTHLVPQTTEILMETSTQSTIQENHYNISATNLINTSTVQSVHDSDIAFPSTEQSISGLNEETPAEKSSTVVTLPTPSVNITRSETPGEFLLLITPRPEEIITSPASSQRFSSTTPILDQDYEASYEYYDYSQEIPAELSRKGSQELQESKKKLDFTLKSENKESILHGYEPDPENQAILQNDSQTSQQAKDTSIEINHADLSNKGFELEQTSITDNITSDLSLELLPPQANATNYFVFEENSATTEVVDASNNGAEFSCSGQPMFKFLSDLMDSQVFHFCSPGFATGQVLDFRFLCLEGRHFDLNEQKCI